MGNCGSLRHAGTTKNQQVHLAKSKLRQPKKLARSESKHAIDTFDASNCCVEVALEWAGSGATIGRLKVHWSDMKKPTPCAKLETLQRLVLQKLRESHQSDCEDLAFWQLRLFDGHGQLELTCDLNVLLFCLMPTAVLLVLTYTQNQQKPA